MKDSEKRERELVKRMYAKEECLRREGWDETADLMFQAARLIESTLPKLKTPGQRFYDAVKRRAGWCWYWLEKTEDERESYEREAAELGIKGDEDA
jgi:hypothetical protein